MTLDNISAPYERTQELLRRINEAAVRVKHANERLAHFHDTMIWQSPEVSPVESVEVGAKSGAYFDLLQWNLSDLESHLDRLSLQLEKLNQY